MRSNDLISKLVCSLFFVSTFSSVIVSCIERPGSFQYFLSQIDRSYIDSNTDRKDYPSIYKWRINPISHGVFQPQKYNRF